MCHGATGKGNDQVRFELTYYALNPGDQDRGAVAGVGVQGARGRCSRSRAKNQIPVAKDKEGEAPFSVDANLLHSSSEGKVLEDPAQDAAEHRLSAHDVADGRARQGDRGARRTSSSGDAVALDGKALSPASLLAELNELGRGNGIGRLDLVENRFVGMKSRGVYETPGGTILLAAHRAIESITLDRGAAHLKDELMPRYAELIYNGFWFAPEREMLQAAIDKSQEHVEGEVRLKLYKGNVIVAGRASAEVAVLLDAGHVRGRQGRLRPEGRRGLHPSQCAAPADAWACGTGRGSSSRVPPPVVPAKRGSSEFGRAGSDGSPLRGMRGMSR